MILSRNLANLLFCYDPVSGDLLHNFGLSKGDVAGYDAHGRRYVWIDGRPYPYWKIIAVILLDEMPRSVRFIDGNQLNTSRKNLKFIKPTI